MLQKLKVAMTLRTYPININVGGEFFIFKLVRHEHT